MSKTKGSKTSEVGFDGKPRERVTIGATPDTKRTSVSVRNGGISQSLGLLNVDPAKVYAFLKTVLDKAQESLR